MYQWPMATHELETPDRILFIVVHRMLKLKSVKLIWSAEISLRVETSNIIIRFPLLQINPRSSGGQDRNVRWYWISFDRRQSCLEWCHEGAHHPVQPSLQLLRKNCPFMAPSSHRRNLKWRELLLLNSAQDRLNSSHPKKQAEETEE